MPRDPSALVRVVTIGHGGWTIYVDRHHRLHGYGDDWQGYVANHAAEEGAVIIDLTTAPYGALCELSINGPLLDVDLPAGTVCPALTRQQIPFAPDRRRGFLGNAGPLDEAAVDVYCRMAAYIGATVQVGYPAGVGRPSAPPPAWLPRRRHRPEGWEPPSTRHRSQEPSPAGTPEGESGVLVGLLPPGWETDGYGDFDAMLVCPHGHVIEQDGRCPEGCVSPLREQGLI